MSNDFIALHQTHIISFSHGISHANKKHNFNKDNTLNLIIAFLANNKEDSNIL